MTPVLEELLTLVEAAIRTGLSIQVPRRAAPRPSPSPVMGHAWITTQDSVAAYWAARRRWLAPGTRALERQQGVTRL
jgi:hypothetical protein